MKNIGFFHIVLAAMLVVSCARTNASGISHYLSAMKVDDFFKENKYGKVVALIEANDVDRFSESLHGVDINFKGNKNVTLLFWAIAKDRFKAFEFLLGHGADSNISTEELVRDEGRLSVMELAAISEDSRYLTAALAHKGDPNFAVDYGNRTIIYEAILNNRMQNIQILVDAGADLEHRDSAGDTSLMVAASINDYQTVWLLLERGADPSVKNRAGYDLLGRMKRFGTRGMNPSGSQGQFYTKVMKVLESRKP